MKTPWAVILCKFIDSNEEPFPKEYYQDLFTVNDTGSPWNIIRFFHDWSHGTLDLTDSEVFGWYQLSKDVNWYNYAADGGRAGLIPLARAAASDHGVNLSPFFSTVVCTNLWQDVGAYLGPTPAESGVVTQGKLTPHPAVLGQELGHVYGLRHSRIFGSTDDYKDPWDVMSVGNAYSASDPEFGSIGPGLNASNMRSESWLDESRVWKSTEKTIDETITLRPLVRHDLPGYLAAELPSGYLVEFRVRDGWDGDIPHAVVLVHTFVDGHSYLMPGNSGSPSLVEGDTFGTLPSVKPPGPQSPAVPLGVPPFSDHGYEGFEVLSIDQTANEARLRIQFHYPAHRPEWLSIDPMALILKGKAYLAWVNWHHPHEPKTKDIEAIVRVMTHEERQVTLKRARALTRYGKVAEDVAAAIERCDRS